MQMFIHSYYYELHYRRQIQIVVMHDPKVSVYRHQYKIFKCQICDLSVRQYRDAL